MSDQPLFEVINTKEPINLNTGKIFNYMSVYHAKFINKKNEEFYLYAGSTFFDVKKNPDKCIVFNCLGDKVYNNDDMKFPQSIVQSLEQKLKIYLTEKNKLCNNVYDKKETATSITKTSISKDQRGENIKYIKSLFNLYIDSNTTVDIDMENVRNRQNNEQFYMNNETKELIIYKSGASIHIKKRGEYRQQIFFLRNHDDQLLFKIENIKFINDLSKIANICIDFNQMVLEIKLLSSQEKIKTYIDIVTPENAYNNGENPRLIINIPYEFRNTSIIVKDSDFITTSVHQYKFYSEKTVINRIEISRERNKQLTTYNFRKNGNYYIREVPHSPETTINFKNMTITNEDNSTRWEFTYNGGSVPSKHISPLKTKKFATMPNGHVYRLYYFNKKWWVKARVKAHIKGNPGNTRFVHVVKA